VLAFHVRRPLCCVVMRRRLVYGWAVVRSK
jgi:hypothetical protein